MEQYKLRGLHVYGQSSPTKVSRGADGKLTVRVEPYKRDGDPFDIEDVDQVWLTACTAWHDMLLPNRYASGCPKMCCECCY